MEKKNAWYCHLCKLHILSRPRRSHGLLYKHLFNGNWWSEWSSSSAVFTTLPRLREDIKKRNQFMFGKSSKWGGGGHVQNKMANFCLFMFGFFQEGGWMTPFHTFWGIFSLCLKIFRDSVGMTKFQSFLGHFFLLWLGHYLRNRW